MVFRGLLLGPLVVVAVKRTFGLDATVAQLGGNLLAGLDLRGVNARRQAGTGPLAAFSADRISARYSLAALMRGREAFLDSLDVTVEGARLDLDLADPPAGPDPAAQPAVSSSFPRLPRLTVRDSRVRISGRGYSIAIDGLQGAVARADPAREQAVEIRAERLLLRHPALREGAVSLAATGSYGPRRLAITAARVNGEPLVERAGLDLGERPGDLDLKIALRLWGGSIEFGMIRRTDGTAVRWDARGVDLQPQLLLVNPALGALRGELSTNGEVRFGAGVSTLAGNLTLDWKGAEIAGRAVDRLAIKGAAASGVVLVERAEGRVGPNEILLHQVSLPASALFAGRWRALLAAASGAFSASLGDLPAFLAIWGVGAGKEIATVPDHRLLLEGSLEKGVVRLARGELATGPGKATLAAVTVRIPREDQEWGETTFSGGVVVDIPNLKELSALFPMPSLGGSLRGEISGTGTFARPEGRASLTGRGIRVAGRLLGDVDLTGRGAAGQIVIDALQVRQGGNRFTAQDLRFSLATLAASDRSAIFDSLDGSFAISATDLPALAALAGLPADLAARIPAKHLLTAAGTVQGRALAITAGSFAAAGGSITVRAARVALPPPGADWRRDTTFGGDLEVDLLDLGAIAKIFELPPLQGSLNGRAQLSGSVGAPAGSVMASGRGIVIDGFRLGDITVRVEGEPQRLRIEAESAAISGGPEGRPISASLAAIYEPGRLRMSAFEVTGSGGLFVRGEGTIPIDLAAEDILSPGQISVRAQAKIPALEELAFLVPPAYALTGAVRADIVVTGSWDEPAARLEISGERLQLPPGTRFAPPGPHTIAGTLTWGKSEARAEKVRVESPSLSWSLSGAWTSPPSLASIFAGSAGAATGSLSLRATMSALDIRWLQDAVPGLRGLRGSVAGELAVDGPAGDPVLSGEIRLADAALRYEDLPPIDALTARATVLRRKVTLNEFGGNVGGSPFTLAGTLDFADAADPVLDLRLKGTNVLLYRDEGLRVRADSDLSLRGPLSALSLTGEMALTDSLYQKNITVASLFGGGEKGRKRQAPGLAGISFPEPPLRDMRFDVRLIAREPFQIKTTVVRGAARPDLRLTGTGLLPILRGPILVDSARVLLPSGALELERGTVLYRESDPDRPALDFGGRMQARGYEITAQIGGTLDAPEIILSSIPPLPREELLLFVLTGAPPGSGSTVGGSFSGMASPMAVYLGKNVVGQLLGGGAKSGRTGFQDRIELQIGREMTRNGSVTLDARLLLMKNPIGRGSTLYITSEKDIYDQYNAGVKILFKFK